LFIMPRPRRRVWRGVPAYEMRGGKGLEQTTTWDWKLRRDDGRHSGRRQLQLFPENSGHIIQCSVALRQRELQLAESAERGSDLLIVTSSKREHLIVLHNPHALPSTSALLASPSKPDVPAACRKRSQHQLKVSHPSETNAVDVPSWQSRTKARLQTGADTAGLDLDRWNSHLLARQHYPFLPPPHILMQIRACTRITTQNRARPRLAQSTRHPLTCSTHAIPPVLLIGFRHTPSTRPAQAPKQNIRPPCNATCMGIRRHLGVARQLSRSKSHIGQGRPGEDLRVFCMGTVRGSTHGAAWCPGRKYSFAAVIHVSGNRPRATILQSVAFSNQQSAISPSPPSLQPYS